MKHAIWIVMVWCAAAWAGGTGGRMGGGNWSTPSRTSTPSSSHSWGGSSSSSSHSSSWSSSGGWSHSSTPSSSSSWSHTTTPSSTSYTSPTSYGTTSSSSSTDYTSTTTYDDQFNSHDPFSFITPGVVLAVLGVLAMFGIIAFAIMRSEAHAATPYWSDDQPFSTGDVDVTVIRIAIDGRARKFVQTELARIAGIADTATDEGRATMLREVALTLRRLRDAWIYGGAVNQPMQELGAAKQTFDRLVDDARVRFQHETITNEQGQKTTAVAPASTPRADEGAGVILVSIIVAARIELFNVNRIGDGEDLRKALDSTGHLSAQQLVAVEVVWMPSEDDDRMSSMELEAKYPRPDLIPLTGALAGKVFCSFCGGPFPGELVTCPHCGAPAPGRETAPAAQHAA